MSRLSDFRQAAALMRKQHGPEHERHEMWKAMADLMDAIGGGANDRETYERALAVAHEYIVAATA